MPATSSLRIGSRASQLARWQAEAVREALQRCWPDLSSEIVTISTEGDRVIDRALPEIGGKGLFTLEIEEALRHGAIDLAVHSLKDLPTGEPADLTLGAIPLREDARDVLVSEGGLTLEELPPGAVVGTSSPRRRAQLLLLRPELTVEPIRGNVGTRLWKVFEGRYDAIVVAAAGLLRLGLERHISTWFNADRMMPAPGQGALAVQRRHPDPEIEAILAAIDDGGLRRAVQAERSFLARLESGCSAPVGAFAETKGGDTVRLRALIAGENDHPPIRLAGSGPDPVALGEDLAEEALRKGAAEIIDEHR